MAKSSSNGKGSGELVCPYAFRVSTCSLVKLSVFLD